MPELKQIEANAPRGANGEAIQVLSPEESTVAEVAIGSGNASAALPANAAVVEVAVTATCRFAFGDSNVDASSGTRRLLLTGVYVYRVPTDATHFAVIQDDAETGKVTVARLQ